MSEISRAIAGWTLLGQLADRQLGIEKAIALLEVPSSAADVERAKRLNLYVPEYDRMRADLAKALRTLHRFNRGR